MFRKPNDPNRYFNFKSNHPLSVEKDVVKSSRRQKPDAPTAEKSKEKHLHTIRSLKKIYPKTFLTRQFQKSEENYIKTITIKRSKTTTITKSFKIKTLIIPAMTL